MAQDTRKDPRAKVLTLTVRYKSATVDEFIEHHSHDVSRGGMFIKTPSPFPSGTLLKFEIKISDDRPVLQGVGRVVWKRETTQTSADLPAGMGVKFIKLDESSRAVIDRLVGAKPEGAASAYESDPAGRDRPSAPGPAASPAMGASARKGTIIGLGSPMKGDFSSLVPGTEPGFFPAQDGAPVQPPPEERTVMKQAAELLQEALKDTSGSVVSELPLYEQQAPAGGGRVTNPLPGPAVPAALANAPTPVVTPSFAPPHAPFAPTPATPTPSFTPAAPMAAAFAPTAPAPAPSFSPAAAAPSFAPAPSPFGLSPAGGPSPAYGSAAPGTRPSGGFGPAGSYGPPPAAAGQAPSYGGSAPGPAFGHAGSPAAQPVAGSYGGPSFGTQQHGRSVPPAEPASGSSGRIFIIAGLLAVAGVGAWFVGRNALGGGTTQPAVTAEPVASETPPAPAASDSAEPATSAPEAAPDAPASASAGAPAAPAASASAGAPAAASASAAAPAASAAAPAASTPPVVKRRKPPPPSTEEKKPPSSEGGEEKKPAPPSEPGEL